MSASIGIVQSGDGGAGAAELMKAADTTLYWAKTDGGNRYAVFDAERHQRRRRPVRAVGADPGGPGGGEFVVEYQPLVRLADRR